MTIKLVSLHLQNFMNYYEKMVDFKKVTRIFGKNGKGKSSILTAYMWLLFNCDYELRDNPKIRREIDGIPVADMDVSVEAVFSIDGTEVTVKKIQRRKFGKDGVSYSDDNAYFINEVPKTLRDFNECLGLDMSVFKICSNVNAFIGKKSNDMRGFLFSTADTVTDFDVACQYDGLTLLMPLLKQYKLEEVVAMNKASKEKCVKELSLLEGQIKEKERDTTVDIGFAELELNRNVIQEEIEKTEQLLDNSEKMYESYQKKSNEIFSAKQSIFDIEEQANNELTNQKKRLQNIIDTEREKFSKCRENIKSYEKEILSLSDINKELEGNAEKKRMEHNEVFNEVLEEDSTICPTCSQKLPGQKIEQLKDEFKEKKNERLEKIIKDGSDLMKQVENNSEEIKKLGKLLTRERERAAACSKPENEAMEELKKLPINTDLSKDKEYQSLKNGLDKLQSELNQIDNGADYRSQLKIKLSGLREELSVVEKDIAKADTTEAEKRLEELRQLRKDTEQKKADCERVLFLVDELDKYKNELLTGEINKRFGIVDWKLFEFSKSGGYKSVCVPIVNKQSILENSANKGNRILGKLDICNSIQKISGINCPVFLDDAESLDSENTDKSIEMMDCQMILLNVSNDKEIKMEVIK